MVLLSALEDFVVKTLGALSGPLSRLAYIGSLRRSGGQYEHWGLERAYGDTAAAAAISDAHTQVWLQVLRTPLRKLAAEAEASASGITAADVECWRNQPAALTPSNPGGGSPRHFHSILLALSQLPHSVPEGRALVTQGDSPGCGDS
jgi:hypothetical protein